MTDLSDLRAKAEAATKGEWEVVDSDEKSSSRLIPYVAGLSEIVAGLDGIAEPERLNDRSFDEDRANMTFIAAASPSTILSLIAAASPSTILSLIDRIERLESENERLRKLDEASESTFKHWRDRALAAEAAINGDEP